MILVGTRLDESSSREVSIEKGKAFADRMKIPFFEVSAKTGENVRKALETLVFLAHQARSASRNTQESSTSEESMKGIYLDTLTIHIFQTFRPCFPHLTTHLTISSSSLQVQVA